MFQSPFGGISMVLNILIICIGLILRFVNRHSRRMREATKEFVNEFIAPENDTILRRVFASSIPFAICITITSAIIFVFTALLKDDKRVPIYTVPSTAYGYIASTNEGKWVVDTFNLPRMGIPVTDRSGSAPLSSEAMMATPPVVEATTSSSSNTTTTSADRHVAFSSGSTSDRETSMTIPLTEFITYRDRNTATPPHSVLVILGTSSRSLTELLKANNIEDSRSNRVKLAHLLGLTDYKGSGEEDYMILKKIQEIQAKTYSFNR